MRFLASYFKTESVRKFIQRAKVQQLELIGHNDLLARTEIRLLIDSPKQTSIYRNIKLNLIRKIFKQHARKVRLILLLLFFFLSS